MDTRTKALPKLPKDALQKIVLGQSFAEYDRMLTRPGVFVETPALQAALDDSRAKCLFVGRRGTGKTAVAKYLQVSPKHNVVQILPNSFRVSTI